MQASIVTIIISIGLLIFALFKAWQLARQIIKKNQSETWQVTNAVVVSKEVIKKFSTRSGANYFPEITYRYSVIGQEFENKIRLLRQHTQRSAEKKIESIGPTCQVRYNPNQPKEHLSEFEMVNYADLILIVIIFVLVGIMLYPYLG